MQQPHSSGSTLEKFLHIVLDKIMVPPKDDGVLIPRTYEYTPLKGKRDFADVIKAKDLWMKKLSWIIWGSPV